MAHVFVYKLERALLIVEIVSRLCLIGTLTSYVQRCVYNIYILVVSTFDSVSWKVSY